MEQNAGQYRKGSDLRGSNVACTVDLSQIVNVHSIMGGGGADPWCGDVACTVNERVILTLIFITG